MADDNVAQDQNVADDAGDDATEEYDPSVGQTIDGDDTDDNDSTDDTDEGDEDSGEDEDSDEDEDGDEAKGKKTPSHEEKMAFAFKKKQLELKEEKEAKIKAQQEIATLKQKLNTLTKPVRPVIPDMPDTFDPEYDAKIKARDKAIVQADRYDRAIVQQKQQVKAAEKASMDQRVAYIKSADKSFAEKATELSISKTELAKSDKVVSATLGKGNAAIAEHILTHEQGPLILLHLGKNDLDREKLAGMTIANAGAFIAQDIVPKLSDIQTKRKRSNAPKPAKTFSGRKPSREKDPFLKGATFE